MGFKKLLLLSTVVTLSACGGGGDDSGVSGVPLPIDPSTGVFLDSPVENMDYTNATGSHMGVTNAAGEFDYLPGETLFFSIGDLDFPQLTARAILTPMDMSGTLDLDNVSTMNIVRLFLTLDQDGDPDNGITINDTAKATATQVDFSLDADAFAASGAVTNLIFNAGQNSVVAGLVSVAEARTHFEAQLVMNDIAFGTIAQQNERDILEYLTENELEATAHDSGMYYNITTQGSGDSPSSTSTVEVKYSGRLLTDVVFDQTSGDTTVNFPLSNLIPGWAEALPLMNPGSIGTFYFPAALGYGALGSGIIPGNAVIIFEIELVSFSN